MAIPDYARTNFNTLLRAAGDGNLALMECADALTGDKRYVIAAVGRDGDDYIFTPFGHLAEQNPYDAYLPPDPDDPVGFLPKPDDGGAA
ncbi:DUF6117 family protein [Agrobacterium tumefaciens]|uniref:DUF6117 family protein n=1 Tax=Agrobacterium tumefaciens TaxID=358 RepID=UPI0022430AE6|nr:DUF6117 family protein [Agrobacterium tumefaciens]MCW8060829.1 DUF6117 family protein [Agrobacterium tumefaciens]